MSSGTPVRLTGYCNSCSRNPASLATSDHSFSRPSVTIWPGATAFTVIPSGPKSIAIWRVRPMTAAFPDS